MILDANGITHRYLSLRASDALQYNNYNRDKSYSLACFHLNADGRTHQYIARWPRNDISVQYFTTDNTKYTNITIRPTGILHASNSILDVAPTSAYCIHDTPNGNVLEHQLVNETYT